MSSGSDDDVSVDAKPARREPSQAAAQTFAEISDDESDDGRLPQRNMSMNTTTRSPSPSMDDDEGDVIRARRGSDSDGNDDRFGSDDDMEPTKPKVVEAHERSVVENLPQKDAVDLYHFPPGLEVSTTVATEAELAQTDAFYPISFRPKRRGDARSAVRSALQRGGAIGIGDILESNARLIEWSDGSHTVMVGDEHYYIMNDKLASDFYLFKKGQDIQTVEAAVNTVGRLQPFNAGGLSSRLSKRSGVVSPVNTNKRKLLLTTKRSGEVEEQQAKEEAERKDREKERLQRKRRATIAAENRNRPRERSPMRRYHSEEEEESDGEAERFAEEEERRIKRRRNNDWSFKHQKAGRRKIVGVSDDEESDD